MTSVSTDYSNKDLFLNSQVSDTTTSSAKADPLGKQAFLTMMVAQLKNQDPLNPMEGTDFTAQLAQFSSLEQQINTNTNLTSILEALNSNSKDSNLFDYIGKTISSNGNPVTVSGGSVASGGTFVLDEPSKINVVVYDSTGKAVRTMTSGTEDMPAGTYNINWDGKDDSGYTVLDGEYTYKVNALTSNKVLKTASTETTGEVSGITSYLGKNYLVVDGKKVDPASVETVSLTKN
jgi:flagellar basal-body rod modification protein FlgD